METKPELSKEEFAIKHQSFVAEINALTEKYDVHAMVFTFGFESGDSMRGAARALGCGGCCGAVFERLLQEKDRMFSQIEAARTQHHGHQVH